MENEILYKQLRSNKVRKSDKYRKWFKKRYPEHEAHHLLGSMTSIKLCDYLLLPLTRTEHTKAEANKCDYCIDNLAKSLNILFEYIKELENEN